MSRNKFIQNTIALVYDFDGTLSPQPMQDYTVLSEMGVDPQKFWNKCSKEAKEKKADGMLTYMRLLLEETYSHKTKFNSKTLSKLAKNIKYFPGVESWFDRIKNHVEEVSGGSVKVKHYIISAGLKEILNGIKIKRHFENMFASEYYFNHNDVAEFPTVVINDTSKTQYLFRINKGIEDINESINKYKPEEDRPIPFSNMLYLGDGLTDVPCMTVTKQNGGFAIAVHASGNSNQIDVCEELVEGNRIDYFAPADYRKGKELEKKVNIILDLMVSKIKLEKEKFTFKNKK